jgi:hypothetical protein
MLSGPNAPVATYTLSNAWPSKYEILPRGGTAGGGAAPEILLETITLTCDAVVRA